MLDDAAFDIEGWLAERIAEKFARSEAAAFILGDGIDKPTGFLHHPAVRRRLVVGIARLHHDWRRGQLRRRRRRHDRRPRLFAGRPLPRERRVRDELQDNGAVRKLKDADGRFLWSDGLQAGEPARLMGYQVVVAEDMPDYEQDGALAIAFGDFGSGYTIAERPDLRMLRDPFSAKPHVLFYATKRVGGDVSDFAAIKLLKFGES